MPKRILMIAFAVTALALAACNGAYNPNNLYGTPVPSATTTATPTVNPAISAAIVTVYASSQPLADWPVSIYQSVNGNAGNLIATQTTDSTGTTTFSNLVGGTNYCFNAQYTPPGGLMQNSWQCDNTWYNGVVFSFP